MAATRQIISHDFSGIGGAAKKNLTGAAIGTIGEGLKDIELPEFSRDQEPNKTSPDLSGFEEPTFNVEAQQLVGDTSILDSLTGQPFKSRPVGNISNTPANNPSSKNPYEAINLDPRALAGRGFSLEVGDYNPNQGRPIQYNALPGTYTPTGVNRTLGSPLNRNGKDKGKEILGRNDKGEVKVKDARGKEVWVTEAPEGSEEKYEQYLQTFHDQRGPDAQPLDIHHAAASGFATPAQSLLAYKSGGRALGKAVGANKRVPTMQDLETIGLADHPLMKKAYPHLFGGETPLERNSPLNRNGRGKLNVDFKGVSQPPPGAAYAGARGIIDGSVASQEIGRMVARNNYKQQVWADKAAEADLEFGKLEQEPSGVSSWDSSVEIMAREWKSDLGDLLKNKGDIDPQEFISKKQEILARSKQFNTAAGMLQKVVGDYNENIDNISAGTDPDVMDLLNTLNKGGGEIGVRNINGTPTMVGTTLRGENVSIPISEIASGRGQLRFAVKENIQPGLDKITQNLSKIKKDRAIAGGALATSTVGWDQLRNSAEPQVDALLNKASTVRAVMADRFNLDFDDLIDKYPKTNPKTGKVEADLDKARAEAKRMLMEDLQKQVSPYQQAATIKRDPRAIQQTVKSTAGERAQAATAETVNKYLATNPDLNTPQGVSGWNTLLAAKGLNVVTDEKKGTFLVKNGKAIAKIDPNDPETNRQLAVQAGVSLGNLPQQSPVKREGPFKRLTNWMTSPFKRDGKGKKSKAPEGADPVTPTLGFEGYEEDPNRIVNLGDDVEAAHREAGGHVTESGGLVQTGGDVGPLTVLGGGAGIYGGIKGGAALANRLRKAGKTLGADTAEMLGGNIGLGAGALATIAATDDDFNPVDDSIEAIKQAYYKVTGKDKQGRSKSELAQIKAQAEQKKKKAEAARKTAARKKNQQEAEAKHAAWKKRQRLAKLKADKKAKHEQRIDSTLKAEGYGKYYKKPSKSTLEKHYNEKNISPKRAKYLEARYAKVHRAPGRSYRHSARDAAELKLKYKK